MAVLLTLMSYCWIVGRVSGLRISNVTAAGGLLVVLVAVSVCGRVVALRRISSLPGVVAPSRCSVYGYMSQPAGLVPLKWHDGRLVSMNADRIALWSHYAIAVTLIAFTFVCGVSAIPAGELAESSR